MKKANKRASIKSRKLFRFSAKLQLVPKIAVCDITMRYRETRKDIPLNEISRVYDHVNS